MKKILLSLFSIGLFGTSIAQSLSVETVQVHTGMVGTVNLAGYTTYRVYVNLDSPNDFVSAVGGDINRPVQLNCEGTVFQSALGSNLGKDINNALFPFFPAEAFDSWLTIDVENTSTPNTFLGAVQDNAQQYLVAFNAGGSFEINTLVGGGWFTLFPSDNGYAGADLKVLLMQITTNGPFCGTLNVDYFNEGVQANLVQANNMSFCSTPGEIFGCMDTEATNYNPNATQQDFSCEYPCGISVTYAITSPLCGGQSNGAVTVNIDGAIGAAYLSWNGGPFQVIYTKTNLAAGNYTVSILDGQGCTFNEVVNVPGPAPITGSISVNSGCSNQANVTITGNFSGGTAPFMYGLTNGNYTSSSPVFTNLGTGLYVVFAIDANGCTGQTSQASVSNPGTINIGAVTATNVSCSGLANGSISATATGGVGGFTYSINGTNYFANGGMFTNVAEGVYTFYAKDGNGCVQNTAPITISALTGYSIFGSVASAVVCNDDANGSIQTGLVGSTTGMVSYGLEMGVYDNPTGVFTGLPAGTYTVYAIDGAGCPSVSAPVTLTNPAALELTLASTVECFGDANTGVMATVDNAVGAVTYSVDGGASGDETILAGLDFGMYTIVAMDENGCQASASIDFAEPTAIGTNLIVVDLNCNADSSGMVTLIADGGSGDLTYSIDGGAFGDSSIFGDLAAGDYVITAMDENGCSVATNATVSEPAAINVNTSSVNVLCNSGTNGSVTAVATGGVGTFTYSNNGGPTNTTGVFNNLGAGNNTITVTDGNGCQATGAAEVTEPEPLQLDGTATGDTGGGNGGVNITVEGGTAPYTYLWSNGAITEDITGLTGAAYSVTVTDANGCTTTQSFNVSVGVFELIAGLNVSLFPNPSQGEFFLNIEGLNGEKVFWQVTDARGRVVAGQEMFDNAGSVRSLVDLTQAADGMYFLLLNVNGMTGTMKLVKH